MLCSMGELKLTTHECPGKEENGILILDEDCADKLGADIRDVLMLNDTCVEFEITSNRPDCLSVIGLARETAVSFDRELKLHTPVVKGAGDGDKIENYLGVGISAPDLCYIPCTICHRHNSVENFKGAYVCRRCLKPLLVGVMVGRFESMTVISEI